MTALEQLAAIIREHGGIPSIVVHKTATRYVVMRSTLRLVTRGAGYQQRTCDDCGECEFCDGAGCSVCDIHVEPGRAALCNMRCKGPRARVAEYTRQSTAVMDALETAQEEGRVCAPDKVSPITEQEAYLMLRDWRSLQIIQHNIGRVEAARKGGA